MRIFVLLLAVFSFSGLFAQEADSVEVEIMTGDTLQIGAATTPEFKFLDMYRKTRWIGNEPAYDTATGEGFYRSFFGTGDFDVAELPASYSGKLFTVIGVEVLTNKNTGQPMNVMYLKGDLPNSVIWVDFDQAFSSGELKLPD